MRWIERLRLTFKRFELRQASSRYLAKHDEAIGDKPFDPKLKAYMTSGPVLIGIILGD
ncbi:hypothetical protein CEH03_01235 [Streptococcus pyogenes]|nr:Nucleoside diphosphate kinase [Streptococcus pyogenes MGAS10270]ERL18973.1 multifunctional nucleoside pyrophosphate kinase/apyrimidinic endonuclease/3' domain protein [Streptococcus pyogenes GA41046]PMD81811.1 hypothetical protein CEH03_01235 [Streptococcus pyogenes]